MLAEQSTSGGPPCKYSTAVLPRRYGGAAASPQVLSGYKRYSHVTAIGCDGVNPGLLGMKKVISEDAMRRALSATPEAERVARRA